MKTLILAACLALTGCSTVFHGFASLMDSQDPCQSRGRPNYQYPSWCGASGSTAYVTRAPNSNRVLYTTQRESW